jgi:PKHD-type hydroxylase
MMKVFKVFNDQELAALNKLIDTSKLVDGAATAKGAAVQKKNNLQITSGNPDYAKISPFVSKALMNPQIKAYTFMQKLLSPRVAVYREGGHYDWHVDTSIMDLHRADLSFTIFLNSADEYKGGELELKLNGAKAKMKGKPGEAIFYASGVEHQVSPVSSGERRVVVGWIRSNIKLHEHRERLYGLNLEVSDIRSKFGVEAADPLNTLYHQFVRDYAD